MLVRVLAVFALGCPLVSPLPGQSVISTRSGLINFSEGLVFLDGQPLTRKFGTYERMKNGSTLVTESGRAEVLLTPNTYLRIGQNSSIRMASDNLSDTRVEILAGSSMLDSEGAAEGNFVKLLFKGSVIQVTKPGRYRVDADSAQLRVYSGEAEVTRDGKTTTLEESQLMPLDGAPVVKKFTDGSDGLLDIWSDERHSMIASNLLDSQSVTDPLLDNGPDGSADYLAYVGPYGGYIPLAALPSLGAGGYYPYGPSVYGPLGYPVYGYSALGYNFLAPYSVFARPSYSSILPIYRPRPIGTSTIFGTRPTGGTTFSRPGFAPRPGASSVHSVGHIGGRR